MDSDDLLLPNAIATYNFVLKANPLAKILSTLFLEEHIDKDGNKYYNFAPINNITWIHGRVYSLDFMSDYCIRFPNIRYGEDVAFNSLFYTLAEKNDRCYISNTIKNNGIKFINKVKRRKYKKCLWIFTGCQLVRQRVE